MNIEVKIDPMKDELDTIHNGLHLYNKPYIGEAADKKDLRFAVLAKDETGHLMGGVKAVGFWGWLHIEQLWVEEESRGTGLGKTLLFKTEAFAMENGFFYSRLETTGFQAKGFYESHGYEIYGVLEDLPKGFNLYHLKKTLKK